MVDGKVSFGGVPAMVVVRKSLSKVGHQYFAFLPEEGCRYLKNCMECRMRPKTVGRPMNDCKRPQVIELLGERLGPDSPLIAARKIKGTAHVCTTKIREEIKQAILTAGFQWRPYVLRRYFEVSMMSAGHDRLILSQWRQFWIGLCGDHAELDADRPPGAHVIPVIERPRYPCGVLAVGYEIHREQIWEWSIEEELVDIGH